VTIDWNDLIQLVVGLMFGSGGMYVLTLAQRRRALQIENERRADESDIKRLREIMTTANEQYITVSERCDKMADRIDALEGELQTEREKSGTAETHAKELNIVLQQANERITALEATVTQQNGRIAMLERLNANKDARILELEKQLTQERRAM